MMAATTDRVTAELDALHAYYDCLSLLADAAIEGEALIPEIPQMAELSVVDGWVVWRGSPVWSPLTCSLTEAQPVRPGPRREALAAWSAAEHRCLDVTQAQLDHDTSRVREGSGSPEVKARNDAEHGFYSSIIAQCRRGIDRGDPPPVVPDVEELEFVDGWLVWQGERVWWSGHALETAQTEFSSTARSNSSAMNTRPRLRRLLTLPWRRAIA